MVIMVWFAPVLVLTSVVLSCCLLRERLIRLQHENKMLKLAQEGSDNEQIALLQSLLEDANSRKNELETENRSLSHTLTLTEHQLGGSPE